MDPTRLMNLTGTLVTPTGTTTKDAYNDDIAATASSTVKCWVEQSAATEDTVGRRAGNRRLEAVPADRMRGHRPIGVDRRLGHLPAGRPAVDGQEPPHRPGVPRRGEGTAGPMTRVTLDPHGVNELMRSPAALALVASTAKAAARAAGNIAPNGGPAKGVAQSYKATAPHPTPTGVAATVYSTDPFAHLVEFGSVHNPAYAPLRRAALRLGLKLRLYPKGFR
jgi:hypothetical protein